jgi:hypothetical protein
MRFQLSKLISAQDMSSNFIINIADLVAMVPIAFAIQTKYTGSMVGSIYLQAKVHPDLSYLELANSRFNVNGNGGNLWSKQTTGYKFIQIVYESTSGIGSMCAYISTQGGL